MRSIVLSVFAAVLFMASCKTDTSTAVPSAEVMDDGPVRVITESGAVQIKPTNLEYDLSTPLNLSVASRAEIKKFRAQAETILASRLEKQPNIPAIIDVGTFFYEFIVKGSEVSEVGTLDNMWVDYKGNNTYSYGHNKDVQGGGRYHYNGDEAILLMIDDDSTIKPQEFNAKHAGDSMVLVGRPTYKDNNMQMKLAKVIL